MIQKKAIEIAPPTKLSISTMLNDNRSLKFLDIASNSLPFKPLSGSLIVQRLLVVVLVGDGGSVGFNGSETSASIVPIKTIQPKSQTLQPKFGKPANE